MTDLATKPDLRGALLECRRVTRRRARNFYYGLRLAPERKRSALFALYAWMREADDLADASRRSTEERRAMLLDFRKATMRAIDGEIPSDRTWLWTALRHAASDYGLDPSLFGEMIDGQLSDLGAVQNETFTQLHTYCYRVGSTVGLLCLKIWGYTGEEAPALAIDRGVAFQLTNILRDFAEDFDDDRVYLPAEDFRRHAITPQQVRTWSEPARCVRFWEEQTERAASYYERSKPLDDFVERDSLPVLWAMTQTYRTLLDKISAAPGRIARGHRARLNPIRKALIALQASRMARSAKEPA